MDFGLITERLTEDEALIERLKQKGVDTLTLTKIEHVMVRDILVLMVTCYQDNVKEAVMTKVKRHSNDHPDIISFISAKIRKTNLDIRDLKTLLASFNKSYAEEFKSQLTNEEETRVYGNILEGRLNVAHDQGNNLQVGSLAEARTAHEHAKNLLTKFEASMWS